jgi:hypothetical protein
MNVICLETTAVPIMRAADRKNWTTTRVRRKTVFPAPDFSFP